MFSIFYVFFSFLSSLLNALTKFVNILWKFQRFLSIFFIYNNWCCSIFLIFVLYFHILFTSTLKNKTQTQQKKTKKKTIWDFLSVCFPHEDFHEDLHFFKDFWVFFWIGARRVLIYFLLVLFFDIFYLWFIKLREIEAPRSRDGRWGRKGACLN